MEQNQSHAWMLFITKTQLKLTFRQNLLQQSAETTNFRLSIDDIRHFGMSVYPNIFSTSKREFTINRLHYYLRDQNICFRKRKRSNVLTKSEQAILTKIRSA